VASRSGSTGSPSRTTLLVHEAVAMALERQCRHTSQTLIRTDAGQSFCPVALMLDALAVDIQNLHFWAERDACDAHFGPFGLSRLAAAWPLGL
jgi:hypothetical protein